MAQNILIGDDDAGVLSALKMLLKSEGFIPVTVESPKQALEALCHQDFNLILMDLNYSMVPQPVITTIGIISSN